MAQTKTLNKNENPLFRSEQTRPVMFATQIQFRPFCSITPNNIYLFWKSRKKLQSYFIIIDLSFLYRTKSDPFGL